MFSIENEKFQEKEITMYKPLSSWVRSLVGVTLAATLLAPQISLAQTKPPGDERIPQLLFVQNAAAVVTDKSGRVLTLKGLSPTTLYFSDRPVRLAGHYRTSEYMKFWKEGPDSFLKDPPNATLSVFQKGSEDLLDTVVTLRNPRLKGNRPELRRDSHQRQTAQGRWPGDAVHRHHRHAVDAVLVRGHGAPGGVPQCNVRYGRHVCSCGGCGKCLLPAAGLRNSPPPRRRLS